LDRPAAMAASPRASNFSIVWLGNIFYASLSSA
jgi:hypothetical protein